MDKSLKNADLKSTWASITKALKADVSGDTYNRWFKDIVLVELDATQLTLRVPNNIYQLWIETNYISLLRAAVLLVLQDMREIRFVLADAAEEPEPEPAALTQRKPLAVVAEAPEPPANGMNPRNTFDGFVVGTNNQFAHAAWKAR